jgi:hypothetical protein
MGKNQYVHELRTVIRYVVEVLNVNDFPCKRFFSTLWILSIKNDCHSYWYNFWAWLGRKTFMHLWTFAQFMLYYLISCYMLLLESCMSPQIGPPPPIVNWYWSRNIKNQHILFYTESVMNIFVFVGIYSFLMLWV